MSRAVAIVVQARMGSTRLPGKVMMPVAGAPILQRMLERLGAVTTPHTLVVATTDATADAPIAALAADMNIACVKGHPTDLIDRHLAAARAVNADVVVKIPSDCPLIDPAIVDQVLSAFFAEPAVDFASNLHPPTWPDGNDVEVMTLAALEAADREATLPMQREHTTPFIWDQPARFAVRNVTWPTGQNFSASHRWTLDYIEDYRLIAAVYEALWRPTRPLFSLAEILTLMQEQPAIAAMNASYLGASWMQQHKHELVTLKETL